MFYVVSHNNQVKTPIIEICEMLWRNINRKQVASDISLISESTNQQYAIDMYRAALLCPNPEWKAQGKFDWRSMQNGWVVHYSKFFQYNSMSLTNVVYIDVVDYHWP